MNGDALRGHFERPQLDPDEFDQRYRRCETHNRARYWCGCADTDPPAARRLLYRRPDRRTA